MGALELLSQASIFRTLSDDDRARIAHVAHVTTYCSSASPAGSWN